MQKTIKKVVATFVVLISISLLSACGGSDNEAAQNLQLYDGTDFSINVDPSWKVINKSDFYAEIPNETVVAFTTPEAYDGFFINVNIVKENLNQAISSVDYGRANINVSGQNLTDYEKVQEVKIDLNGQPALLHIFQARLNASEKLIRFIQLYATKGRSGYIVSGGMLADTPKEIRDTVGAIVTSFKLK